ncbi:MAG: response regulator transcription factor [Actinomycetota bacterium]|nr:response regulator transcription factor [Actinomycetota bacterium]
MRRVIPLRPVRVLLVNDHASFCQALAIILDREPEFEVVGQAGTIAEARKIPEGMDAAIVDLALPDGDGARLVEGLRSSSPGASVMVLRATLDVESFARALEAGADGVMSKLAGPAEIIAGLRRLRAGEALPCQEDVRSMLRLYVPRHGPSEKAREAAAHLTAGEWEALRALAEGLDREGVAGRLGLGVEEERELMMGLLGRLGARSSGEERPVHKIDPEIGVSAQTPRNRARPAPFSHKAVQGDLCMGFYT